MGFFMNINFDFSDKINAITKKFGLFKKIKQLIKKIKELKTENLFNPRVAIIFILNTSVPRNCISGRNDKVK